MTPFRTRVVITSASRPLVPPHVHLRFDDLRGKWVVLAPEKVLWPDEIGADILGRCTGAATVSDIVGGLAEDYDAPAEQIAPDVLAFLQEWCDRLLLRCEETK
ncbi:pyrroloquinoline quinone biosynthesis peptide chaperone PqqD [Roseibium marinum]|uniref:Pyrroloquinoline quinone biosynthesis protein D n=1 Tax=Roseibium marinum TaxID=281252 RepID=A0A2S3US44_9HYPH|nr:pyrroloquinoline quinone biosynthesis peptide chaperone PqqD [Roseibium marinum]POF30548.1 pyrroloquinoline quinone biosynthesis protein D [Roseibium marinum]